MVVLSVDISAVVEIVVVVLLGIFCDMGPLLGRLRRRAFCSCRTFVKSSSSLDLEIMGLGEEGETWNRLRKAFNLLGCGRADRGLGVEEEGGYWEEEKEEGEVWDGVVDENSITRMGEEVDGSGDWETNSGMDGETDEAKD
eukprot:TRINITY_DN3239_c0_g1_i1.p1 TRINITY_DN3239_c0_g1~~TRINITY_DN3239_c0_g1_i1.p1  ORF type:complete len:141 (-),score=20.63 TRINITY_DN3239_c0_g1_i1:1428-1850(-)